MNELKDNFLKFLFVDFEENGTRKIPSTEIAEKLKVEIDKIKQIILDLSPIMLIKSDSFQSYVILTEVGYEQLKTKYGE
jgi:hypothetical protein